MEDRKVVRPKPEFLGSPGSPLNFHYPHSALLQQRTLPYFNMPYSLATEQLLRSYGQNGGTDLLSGMNGDASRLDASHNRMLSSQLMSLQRYSPYSLYLPCAGLYLPHQGNGLCKYTIYKTMIYLK